MVSIMLFKIALRTIIFQFSNHYNQFFPNSIFSSSYAILLFILFPYFVPYTILWTRFYSVLYSIFSTINTVNTEQMLWGWNQIGWPWNRLSFGTDQRPTKGTIERYRGNRISGFLGIKKRKKPMVSHGQRLIGLY